MLPLVFLVFLVLTLRDYNFMIQPIIPIQDYTVPVGSDGR